MTQQALTVPRRHVPRPAICKMNDFGCPWCLPSSCRLALLGYVSGLCWPWWLKTDVCLWHGFCFLALACLGACHLGAGLSCSGGVPLAPGLPMVENTVLAFGMAFAFWPWLALVLAILVQVCLALGGVPLAPGLPMVENAVLAFGMAFAFWPWLALVLAILVQVCLALGVCLCHLDCLWWRMLCLPLAWLLLSGLGLPLVLAILVAGLSCSGGVPLAPGLPMVENTVLAFGMAFAFWPWLALVLAILVQVCLALGVCLCHLDCLWWRMLCLPLAWLPYLAFARPTLPLPCLLLLCGWCCCCLFAGCFVWRGGLPIQRVDGAYQRKPCELQHACQQQNWPYWFHFPFQVLSTYK